MKLKVLGAIFKEEKLNTVTNKKETHDVKKDVYVNVDQILTVLDVPGKNKTVLVMPGMQVLVDDEINKVLAMLQN